MSRNQIIMSYQQTLIKGLKQGCLFYALSTLLLAIQFDQAIKQLNRFFK